MWDTWGGWIKRAVWPSCGEELKNHSGTSVWGPSHMSLVKSSGTGETVHYRDFNLRLLIVSSRFYPKNWKLISPLHTMIWEELQAKMNSCTQRKGKIVNRKGFHKWSENSLDIGKYVVFPHISPHRSQEWAEKPCKLWVGGYLSGLSISDKREDPQKSASSWQDVSFSAAITALPLLATWDSQN